MSRREQNHTDDSTTSVVSVTDSLRSLMAPGLRAAGEYDGFTFLDQTALREYGPEQILNRMLSIRSYISATSSVASRNQHAQDDPDLGKSGKIGEGQCGTVWALFGTAQVLKVSKVNKVDQLYNDSVQHKRVQDAFDEASVQLRKDVNIPRYGQWIHPSNERFWDEHIEPFPQHFSKTYAFMSSRILPLPLPVRAAIVDAFSPDNVKARKDAFLNHEDNKHCLVRLYLGRREKRSNTKELRLRNFELTVGEMEYLRLDTHLYATTMARALAVLHWKAGVDANDVEFVLGSSPAIKSSPILAELLVSNCDSVRFITGDLDFRHRSVSMWLLDFDQCQVVTESKQPVELLKRGFYHNDPYYPRPISTDVKDLALWKKFKEVYLEASAGLTGSDMPTAFIEAVEVEGKRRRDGGSMFQ